MILVSFSFSVDPIPDAPDAFVGVFEPFLDDFLVERLGVAGAGDATGGALYNGRVFISSSVFVFILWSALIDLYGWESHLLAGS